MKIQKRFFAVAIALIFAGSLGVSAQDFHKGEFFGGYTYQRNSNDYIDLLASAGLNLKSANGLTVAGTYNFNRYAGVKGEFSWVRSSGAAFGGYKVTINEASFMGGIQFKDNQVEGSKLRPFAHVLVGANSGSAKESGSIMMGLETEGGMGIMFSPGSYSATKLTMAIGGGIDYRISDRVSLRAIQFDYKPTFTGDELFGLESTGTVSALRFSFGVVFN